MLSPASNDKNRKAELERKKNNPADFGSFGGNKKPKDFKENIGLKKASTDVEEETEEATDTTDTTVSKNKKGK